MMFPQFPMTRDQIIRVKLKTPEEVGRRWMGMKHEEAIAGIIRQADREKVKIENERYALSADKADIAACFDMTNTRMFKYCPVDYRFSLGFISSNARRRAMAFYAGITHQDESHGMCFAMITTKQHTTGTDFTIVMEEVFDAWHDECQLIEEKVDNFRMQSLTTKDCDYLLCHACRGGIKDRFKWSKIGLVDKVHSKLVKNPRNRSSWTLYQAFSHVVKTTPPLRQMDVSIKMRLLLPFESPVQITGD